MVTIALAQINPCVGDLRENADKIIGTIKQARLKKVDILVFPELALVGYPPEDLLLKPQFVKENFKYLELIKEKAQGIIVIVGFVDRIKGQLYNAAAFLVNGKIKDVYHKIHLPNYGVFDEKRYFTPGDTPSFYQFNDYRFSVNICEDIWEKSFVNSLKNRNLDFIINLSASPFHIGKFKLRQNILSFAASQTHAYLLYCNLVGGQDELVFDGASMVFSPQGHLIRAAKRFTADLLIYTLDPKRSYPIQTIKTNETEEAFYALCLGLKDYVKKNAFKKVIVGVSGGVDSGVVVSLAVCALGKENVAGLVMPSRYTSKGTLRDAQKVCKNLRIKCHTLAIDAIFDCYLCALQPFFKHTKRDKTEENLQARIRGNLLMAFSNKLGYLVLNTGNKSEVSCGYCTLYGDMVGGFGVLKDVPKVLVYKLAHFINRKIGKATIPLSVIKRPPSAELKPNQKDTDTLPAYNILDPIVKLYVEEDKSFEEIVRAGFKRDVVRDVIGMIDSNEYKRRQAPVGIKITPRAFGRDRRMPITNKFQI
jgi:NAD+ synthase (glutamine-hydrolysing)